MLVGLVGIVETEYHRWLCCLRSFGAVDVEKVVVDEGEDFLVQVV